MLLLSEEKMEVQSAMLLNPLQLAYIGDVVWEIVIRQSLVLRRLNVHHMHEECVKSVNAKAQAQCLNRVQSHLSETEHDIAQRGRNAHARHPGPRNQNPADYADATAFETLVGFLYLTDQQERLKEIIRIAREENEVEQ